MQPDVMIIKTGNKIRAYCLVRSTSKNVIPEKMNEFLNFWICNVYSVVINKRQITNSIFISEI
jgi:hypothetical protein